MLGDVTVVTAAPEPQAKNVADLTVDVVQCFTRHLSRKRRTNDGAVPPLLEFLAGAGTVARRVPVR